MNATPPPSRISKRPGPPAWRRRLPLIGALVLVAAIAIGLWPRAVPVEVAGVTRGPLVVTVDEEGMTRVKHRYVVTAPVAGQLRRIDWKAGAVVEAGKTPLAIIESSAADFLDTRALAQAEARVRAAEAAREMAIAQRARAESAERLFAAELERAAALRAKKVISAQEFDMTRMRADTAAQDVRAAEFALQVAAFELQQARVLAGRGGSSSAQREENLTTSTTRGALIVTSPVSGRILRVFQESERVVPAGFALLEVGDPTELEVRIEVLSRDAVAIAPGARVMLEQWGGGESLTARVRHVEPSAFTKISALGVEEQRVYVIADLADTPEKRPSLGDSYRVEARIVTWEKPDALRVPAGALFERAGRWHAYAIDGTRAQLRNVTIGRSNGVLTEVTAGLQEGVRVIVYPGDKVADGLRVAPLEVGLR
ncbi:MAG: HlyD family efflux transporter periplasmic adaptor subunit [Opitutaceae bacterium]|nr:HlyD family efflux transporter periplasmic adaptor subunit [Opitutaceae bacterium]